MNNHRLKFQKTYSLLTFRMIAYHIAQLPNENHQKKHGDGR